MPKDMTYNIEVGKRLFDARKNINMTRAELGKKVDLHESTVKRYEDGQIKALDIDKIREFASALDTTPEYLMGWDEPEQLPNGWYRVSAKDLSKAMVAQVAENGVAYGKLAPKNKTLADRLLAYVDKLNKLDSDDLEEINQIIDMKLAKSKYQN